MIGFSLWERAPVDPEQAALWWASRKATSPDRFSRDKRFQRWLQDPQNARAWSEYDRRLTLVDTFAAMPEVRVLREASLAALTPRRKPFKYATGGLVAACLIAGLGVNIGPKYFSTGNLITSADAKTLRRYSSAVGGRRRVALPDGSKVLLDTGSTVEIAYSARRRDVRLVEGRAYFNVAHNSGRPFVVSAGNRMVTATGTAFDVEVDKIGRVRVLLTQGHVHIDPIRPAGLAKWIPAIARQSLDPGQSYGVSPGDEPEVAIADVTRETAWREGVIIFREDRLDRAIERLNHYSRKQFIIEDSRISELAISGVFPTARQEDFLAAITTFYPIVAEREASGTIALRWRRHREEKNF